MHGEVESASWRIFGEERGVGGHIITMENKYYKQIGYWGTR